MIRSRDVTARARAQANGEAASSDGDRREYRRVVCADLEAHDAIVRQAIEDDDLRPIIFDTGDGMPVFRYPRFERHYSMLDGKPIRTATGGESPAGHLLMDEALS